MLSLTMSLDMKTLCAQAITEFLASMGLTYEEFKDRPALVDTLLAYHILPGKRTGNPPVAVQSTTAELLLLNLKYYGAAGQHSSCEDY